MDQEKGKWNAEIGPVLVRIGAEQTRKIYEKALAATVLPEEKRRQIWDDCDNAFYAYPDDRNACNYAFILAHKEAFT